jgi:Mg2+ and Co2+ transporter CorA
VGGFLTAALNMEDQISRGVYEEYMARANWPAGLDEATFERIQERLTTLVEDTQKHHKILQALIREHANSK